MVESPPMARKKTRKVDNKDKDQTQIRYRSADRVVSTKGRQYHISLAPGEVASNILLCGDPGRATRIAQKFESIRVER